MAVFWNVSLLPWIESDGHDLMSRNCHIYNLTKYIIVAHAYSILPINL